MDYSLFDDLHFKEVFVGVGIDQLIEAIKKGTGDGYLFHRKPKSVIINS